MPVKQEDKNMSSHHIVREKQEPALLILSLDGFSEEHLGQLLEWSPTLITTAQVAEQLIVYGIKVDHVITNDVNEVMQSDIKIIHPHNQTYLKAAFDYLLTQGYPAVNVITNEWQPTDYEAYTTKINLVVFYNGLKIYTVSPGFSKWKPAGDTVLILSPGIKIETEGLRLTAPGEYETTADGLFTLKFEEQYLFVAEQY